jgi:hypothetical protein
MLKDCDKVTVVVYKHAVYAGVYLKCDAFHSVVTYNS